MGILDFFSSSPSSSSASSSSSTPSNPSSPSTPTPTTTPAKIQTSEKMINPLNPTGIKPCCACPTTKSARDDCFLSSNLDPTSEEGQERCRGVVERHRECMRGLGFKV